MDEDEFPYWTKIDCHSSPDLTSRVLVGSADSEWAATRWRSRRIKLVYIRSPLSQGERSVPDHSYYSMEIIEESGVWKTVTQCLTEIFIAIPITWPSGDES